MTGEHNRTAAEEALDFLRGEKDEAATRSQLSRTIAQEVGLILGSRTAFLKGKRVDHWGCPKGLIGGGSSGIYVTRGTHRAWIGERQVALKDEEAENQAILLVEVGDSWELNFGARSIIASIKDRTVSIPGVENPQVAHLQAVSTIVTELGEQLPEERYQANLRGLPKLSLTLGGFHYMPQSVLTIAEVEVQRIII